MTRRDLTAFQEAVYKWVNANYGAGRFLSYPISSRDICDHFERDNRDQFPKCFGKGQVANVVAGWCINLRFHESGNHGAQIVHIYVLNRSYEIGRVETSFECEAAA